MSGLGKKTSYFVSISKPTDEEKESVRGTRNDKASDQLQPINMSLYKLDLQST